MKKKIVMLLLFFVPVCGVNNDKRDIIKRAIISAVGATGVYTGLRVLEDGFKVIAYAKLWNKSIIFVVGEDGRETCLFYERSNPYCSGDLTPCKNEQSSPRVLFFKYLGSTILWGSVSAVCGYLLYSAI